MCVDAAGTTDGLKKQAVGPGARALAGRSTGSGCANRSAHSRMRHTAVEPFGQSCTESMGPARGGGPARTRLGACYIVSTYQWR